MKIQDGSITGFVNGTSFRFAIDGHIAEDGSFEMRFERGVFRGTLSEDGGQGEYSWVVPSGPSCPGTFTMRRKQ